MRFTINKEEFLKSLTLASRATAGKNPLPIFSNLKLSINENGLEVVGSNGELSILASLPAKKDEREVIRNIQPGSILVNAKIITEIIRKMEKEEISFEVIDETAIQIEDGKSNFQLNSIRAEEYPDIEFGREGIGFSIDSAQLAQLVEQTAFAASIKEQRGVLTALNLAIENGELTATATDSARLSKKVIEVDTPDTASINIVAKSISDIVRLFEGEGKITLTFETRKAIFRSENLTISTTLLNGDYPQTKNLVPKNFNYYLRASAQELVSAMERVSLLSGERENVVKLSMSSEGVEIAARSSQTGSAKERIENAEFEGEKLNISFNSLYVAAAIRALKCDEVTIAFVGEMKPFVVKNDQDDSIVELVTPVRTF